MTERADGQVLLLNNTEVESLLTMRDVMRALDEAYLELDRGMTANRPRTFTFSPTDTGRFVANTHEGLIRNKGVYDIRIVTHSRPHPALNPSQVNYFHGALNCSLDMLYDIDCGNLLAIIHDGYLQKMRVQATNAIAARYMARKNVHSMALLGSGWQATAAIEAMRFVRSIQKVNVFSRNSENRKRFVQQMRSVYKDLDIQDFDSAEQAVRGTDMVVAATNSKVPVCKGEWIETGMHLTGVLPCEFDLHCYKKADYIVIFNRLHGRDYTLRRGPEEEPLDIPPHAELIKGTPEIADLVSEKVPGRKSDVRTLERADLVVIRAREPGTYWFPRGHEPKGSNRESRFTGVKMEDKTFELGDVMLGKAPTRSNDRQITFFGGGGTTGSNGLGIQFAAVAARIYELAKTKGLGREVPLDWFTQDVHP